MSELNQAQFVGQFPDFGKTNFFMMDEEDFDTLLNEMPVEAKNVEVWILPSETIRYSNNKLNSEGKAPECQWIMAVTYHINGAPHCAVNSAKHRPILFDGVFTPLRNFVYAGYGAPRLGTFAIEELSHLISLGVF